MKKRKNGKEPLTPIRNCGEERQTRKEREERERGLEEKERREFSRASDFHRQ